MANVMANPNRGPSMQPRPASCEFLPILVAWSNGADTSRSASLRAAREGVKNKRASSVTRTVWCSFLLAIRHLFRWHRASRRSSRIAHVKHSE
jgi:hypothetical protein